MKNLEKLEMEELVSKLHCAETCLLHAFLYEKEHYSNLRKERLELKEEYERRIYGR